MKPEFKIGDWVVFKGSGKNFVGRFTRDRAGRIGIKWSNRAKEDPPCPYFDYPDYLSKITEEQAAILLLEE